MQHTFQLDAIREVVTQAFEEYASPAPEFSETVLVREGFYCGRCFTCETARAVWFAEENIVKIYGIDGQFLDSRSVELTPPPQLRAA